VTTAHFNFKMTANQMMNPLQQQESISLMALDESEHGA
jgi:hypothetical protein